MRLWHSFADQLHPTKLHRRFDTQSFERAYTAQTDAPAHRRFTIQDTCYISYAYSQCSPCTISKPANADWGDCPTSGQLTSGTSCSFECNSGFQLSRSTTTCTQSQLTTQTCKRIITSVLSPLKITRLVGEANPTFTFEYSGFASGDTAANTIATPPSVSGAPAVNAPVGTYTLTIYGGSFVSAKAASYVFVHTQGGKVEVTDPASPTAVTLTVDLVGGGSVAASSSIPYSTKVVL